MPSGTRVCVIDRERPLERGGGDPIEEVPALLDAVAEVVDLGALGLPVQVFEHELHASALRTGRRPLDALERRGHAQLLVSGEMVAGVDHDPPCLQARREVDVGLEVAVDRVAHERRDLGDVDRRERVQAEVNAMFGAGRAHPFAPAGIETLERVRADVHLAVDVADLVRRRDPHGLLDGDVAAEIHADPIDERHQASSLVRSASRREL